MDHKRTSTMWQTFIVKLNISGMTKIQHIYKYTMCQTDSSVAGRRDYHDDVIKWKHFPRYWPFVGGIHRSPVTAPHKGQWRGVLIFSYISVWINDWVNTREAGDLRRYRDHYDVTVMFYYTGIGIQVRIQSRVPCGGQRRSRQCETIWTLVGLYYSHSVNSLVSL